MHPVDNIEQISTLAFKDENRTDRRYLEVVHPVDDIEQGETEWEEVPGILSGISGIIWYFV